MCRKGPGKSHRNGTSFIKLVRMFPDNDAARKWFESRLWTEGPHCPYCGSYNIQCNIKHKSMTHRCRDCEGRPMFSLKTGNIMEGSKLDYQTWAVAIHLVTTKLKGVSSMKLHRDLEITQKSAWHLAHRLRKCMDDGVELFKRPVEVDETYIGGKRRNMSNAKRKELKGTGRGAVGKAAVVGAKDRDTNKVTARHVECSGAPRLARFVAEKTKAEAKVYTDETKAYNALDPWFDHESVNHSVSEFVIGMAHTNGMDSFWSMLKRGYHGKFHQFSAKHTDRYVTEFAGRHNIRDTDTISQMQVVAQQSVGKRLRYRELVA